MCVGVSSHAHFASGITLSSPLPFPSPCICNIFLVRGGEDKAFILSKSAFPPTFPINNSTSYLFVKTFLVHVHVTLSVVLYVIMCSSPFP